MHGSVFVSNARTSNDFAEELCRRLRTGSIPFFHYMFENTIEVGHPWSAGLHERLRGSRQFIVLITPDYWKSSACRAEFRMAEDLRRRGRLRILPYVLEPDGRPLALQGRFLYQVPSDQWADQILSDVRGCPKRRPAALRMVRRPDCHCHRR
jgi:hypothetical protein